MSCNTPLQLQSRYLSSVEPVERYKTDNKAKKRTENAEDEFHSLKCLEAMELLHHSSSPPCFFL